MAKAPKKPKGFAQAKSRLKDIEKTLIKVTADLNNSGATINIPFPSIKLSESGLDKAVERLGNLPSRYKKAHKLAMTKVAQDLKKALDDAMEADVWDWWDGTRDIVDTGALRDSGAVRYNSADDSLSITYGEEYAAIVHFSGYAVSGYNPSVKIFYPERPWITATIEGTHGITKFPMEQIYTKALRDNF